MPKFTHKKSGYPVTAVQFTGPESAFTAAYEMSCSVDYRGELGVIDVDGVRISRGEYAVMSMAAIVAMDSDVFNRRFRKVEIQEELF